MPDTERRGPFWDAIEGRAPMPPAARLLGWQLEEIDPDAGTIAVRYEPSDEFTNPMGNIQGGFVAAMLDDAMGPALIATLPPDEFAPTLEMKVAFLEPARVGPLWAHGRVVKRAKRHAFVEGDLVDGDGTLIAKASATVQIIKTDRGSDPSR